MTWETVAEQDHGVEVKMNKEVSPKVLAIFDEGEQIGEPVAAMQAENLSWEAIGYAEGKEKYCDDIDKDR